VRPPSVHATSSGPEGAGGRDWQSRLAGRLPSDGWRTRFAPAPTGLLHLGHLVNALYVWGIARAFGGRVLLRVEDHDRTRCRPEYEHALLDDLDWLGFEPDEFPTASFRMTGTSHASRQSDNGPRYTHALARLHEHGLVFPCDCTRRSIAEASPRREGAEVRYPGTCRDRHLDGATILARRIRVDPGIEAFDDLRLGSFADDPSTQCGDVLARDRHGGWTYQFAVTVDDLEQGVDVIIRGEDLLASTARQRRIARLLGRDSPPQVLHHPLLVHAGGAKLSKALGDTALRERRAAGARAEALIGEAAFLVGLQSSPTPLKAADVGALFRG
jgi:glutamyl/glutaminyl-tRNA synthetase